jgi:predicted nucleotidyltransferase
MALLTKGEIVRALTRLGELADAEGESLRLTLVGGAVMALAYNARLSTQDVDAFISPPPDAARLRHWVSMVATELGWPDDWLNDGAKGFVHGYRAGSVLLSTNGIEVRQLAPEQLLAMKLSAWRDDTDINDARRLLLEFDNVSLEHVWATLEPFLIPGQELKARYALEDLWESS